MNRSDKRGAAGRSGPSGGDAAVRALLQEGFALHRGNRLDDAASRYGQVLRAMPGQPQASHLLGLIEHQRNNPQRAFDLISAAVTSQPRNPDFRADLGVVLRAMRRLREALAALREADRLRPNNPRILGLLAATHLDLGDVAAAANCYRRAVQAAPGDAGLSSNLGNVLNMLGDLPGALAAFRRALELDPKSAAARSNYGHALAGAGDLDGAITQFEEALRLEPEALAARMNLAFALNRKGRLAEAEAAFEAALALNPHAVEAIAEYAGVLYRMGRLSDAIMQFERVLQHDPDNASALSKLLFLHNYLADREPLEMTAGARRLGELLRRDAGPVKPHLNNPDPDRRIKVGLVSGDLRAHPVGRFLLAPLAEIDREAIDLFAYSVGSDEDAVTAQLQRSVPNWRRVAHLDAAQLAETIRADGVDVLVDLSGLTGDNRLPAFARKPAPVAVTWLGYFATTGLDTIDYVLCNDILVPASEESQWVEQPWRMPDTYYCFALPPPVAVGELPARSRGEITFGSFNNLNKLSDRTAALWAGVLKAVPRSRLLLRSEALGSAETVRQVQARFAGLGIDPARLTLEGHLSDYAAHLATYNRVDIALDSFPYTGGTTSVEALWMGVPVLTIRGDRFVAHMGENVLHQAGLDDWIAADEADFVTRAVAFVADLDRLAVLRAALRERVRVSPLFDAPRFAGNLEAAFRGMWQVWCAGQTRRAED